MKSKIPYLQRPAVKAHKKRYQQTYQKLPRVKKVRKKYREQPDVKARYAAVRAIYESTPAAKKLRKKNRDKSEHIRKKALYDKKAYRKKLKGIDA